MKYLSNPVLVNASSTPADDELDATHRGIESSDSMAATTPTVGSSSLRTALIHSCVISSVNALEWGPVNTSDLLELRIKIVGLLRRPLISSSASRMPMCLSSNVVSSRLASLSVGTKVPSRSNTINSYTVPWYSEAGLRLSAVRRIGFIAELLPSCCRHAAARRKSKQSTRRPRRLPSQISTPTIRPITSWPQPETLPLASTCPTATAPR